MSNDRENQKNEPNEFAAAADEEQMGIIAEFVEFIKENKKYWLIPLLVILLFMGLLLLGSSSIFGPYIYTLF